MTNEDLKLKVINAQAKVEKKAAILWKHRQQLDKLITKGADDYAIRSKHRDIGEASKKLSEAQASLANWKEKYAEKIRQDDYLEANAPEILVKFLDDWKQRAITYYLRRYDSFIEFREELKQKERDALEPQVISDIIREHVTKYRDESTYQAVKRREAREKELLEDVAENWGGLAENWDEIKDTYC